jgi:hypothetical protein
MNEVPPKLQELLALCPLWNGSGTIQLTANWKSLRDITKQAPTETGIYALGLPFSLCYPAGCSSIIYIGSSEVLCNRLTQYLTTSHNEIIELLKDTFPELIASFWLFPKLPTKWLRTIEGETLWSFEHNFGTVPIANLDIPESKLRDGYSGLVTIPSCKQTKDSLTLAQLAERLVPDHN